MPRLSSELPKIVPDVGSEPAAPKKKKQKLVKHKHKNWAKTDIGDIEKAVDDYRHQQLTGGLRSEKKDEELFFIDKSKSAVEGGPKPKPRKLTLAEKLAGASCYKNLKPNPHSAKALLHSREPGIPTSKNQIKMLEHETKKWKARVSAKGFQSKGEKRKKRANESDEEIEAESDKQTPEKKKLRKIESKIGAKFNKDLWNSTDMPEITHTNEYFLVQTKKLLPKKPEKLSKIVPSKLPAIETPHPGTSYNPDFDDHQELLLKAHEIELVKLKAEAKLIRHLGASLKKKTWAELDQMWIDEMNCKELFDPAEEEAATTENGSKNDEEGEPKEEMSISKRELKRRMNNQKSNTNDTKAKRDRKKLLDKIKKRKQENDKQVRIQQNEIFRLKSIRKELDAAGKTHDEMLLQRELKEAHHQLFGTKKLGRARFEEPELELKLSDEITGNLRNLKPEGNIMTDRYKSMQKRNVIEPRIKAKKSDFRKFWTKTFAKKTALETTNFAK